MLRTSFAIALVLLGTLAAATASFRNLPVAFRGAGGGTWHIVASRARLDATQQYQDRLTVYAPNGRVAYRSPGDSSELLARMSKENGAPRYFPDQTLTVLGAARLMGGSAAQAVVRVTQVGADCGSVTIAVIGAVNGGTRIAPVLRITNPCALDARIARDTIVLTGPYYNANAPLCCPTKNHVVATVRYHNGRWIETPKYFATH